jgi:hypothetical protein
MTSVFFDGGFSFASPGVPLADARRSWSRFQHGDHGLPACGALAGDTESAEKKPKPQQTIADSAGRCQTLRPAKIPKPRHSGLDPESSSSIKFFEAVSSSQPFTT